VAKLKVPPPPPGAALSVLPPLWARVAAGIPEAGPGALSAPLLRVRARTANQPP
jgi:hypothetical protein